MIMRICRYQLLIIPPSNYISCNELDSNTKSGTFFLSVKYNPMSHYLSGKKCLSENYFWLSSALIALILCDKLITIKLILS